MASKFVKNAVGRMIPEKINGKPVIPYQGVHKYITDGKRYAPPLPSSANYPEDGNKQVKDLKTALKKAGIKDVDYKFYPGVRHEILNDINKKEVYRDIIEWLDKH